MVLLDFDGVDCPRSGNRGKTNHCYAVNLSNMVAASKLLLAIPHPFDIYLRTILLTLPKYLLPKPEPYGAVLVIDPESSTPVVKLLQDPSGRDVSHLTGVTVYDNKLYLGSLTNDFVGVYDLS
jgi:hypothetical protein